MAPVALANKPMEDIVGEALRKRINTLSRANDPSLDSFFVCDLGELKRLVDRWLELLPRVQPYYAVKCNNDSKFVRTIARMGLGFDCASKTEIEQVIETGVTPDRIIYANPCKAPHELRYAKEAGVELTTVDNIDELYKIRDTHPDCGLLIRIATDDRDSLCPLSVKFGASLPYSKEMIDTCLELQLNLKGVAFHVGSGCTNLKSIYDAVSDSAKLFEYYPGMNVLDVGGGFSKDSFADSSRVLRDSLNHFFPPTRFADLTIISELGRYLSASCFTLAANVIAKRSGPSKERIYLNDGVYGNLNCILYDHQVVHPKTLTSGGQFVYYDAFSVANKEFSVWGPTCDGLDCITKQCHLSHEVQIGDWIYFENIGAYTMCATTRFNGFKYSPHTIYIDSEI